MRCRKVADDAMGGVLIYRISQSKPRISFFTNNQRNSFPFFLTSVSFFDLTCFSQMTRSGRVKDQQHKTEEMRRALDRGSITSTTNPSGCCCCLCPNIVSTTRQLRQMGSIVSSPAAASCCCSCDWLYKEIAHIAENNGWVAVMDPGT